LTHGASHSGNGTVEIYDGATLVATSAAKAISGSVAAAVFDFSAPVALTMGKVYKATLQGSAAVALYDIRHNRRKPTKIRYGLVDVTNLYNGSNTSLASTSLAPIALRLAL